MNTQQLFKIPLGILQIATHTKKFHGNPIIGSRLLNEKGLHLARRQAAAYMAAHRRKKIGQRLAPDERAAFEANGFFIRHQALPEPIFAALQSEIQGLRTQGWEMRQGNALTRRISLDKHVLLKHPACKQVAQDPGILDLIAYAASSTGDITCQIQAVVVDNEMPEADPQTRLHSDTFHATAKAWLFLHDVAPEEGPFSYVPGSHRLTPERLAWEYKQSLTASESPDQMHREGSFRINEDELADLGLPPPLRLAVPANTLIVADTSGFHARTPSLRPSHRVEIYASLRRNPFLPWSNAHLFSMPFISGHHMALDIKLKHLSGFGNNGRWKSFDDLNAYEPARI